VPTSASSIQQGIIHFLERKRLVDGWLSVEVGPLDEGGGVLEGEMFLARRLSDGVDDGDLERVRDELERAFAEGDILIEDVRSIELRAVDDGFFNERAHPQLGTVRTLAVWIVVTPD
jgi:hypothetical protein